jgi:hypothetical protein
MQHVATQALLQLTSHTSRASSSKRRAIVLAASLGTPNYTPVSIFDSIDCICLALINREKNRSATVFASRQHEVRTGSGYCSNVVTAKQH